MKQYIIKDTNNSTTKKHFTIDYKKELNEAQYEAVTTINGPVLVIAGAGSGKTRALTYRVARLVEEGIRPDSILLLTFTRRASQEMLRRAASLIDSRCEKVAGGTFHSFANIILRKHAKAIGFEPNFTILDRSDSEDVINLLRSKFGLSSKERRFPRKSTIQDIFSKSANKISEVETILESEYIHFYEYVVEIKMLHDAYKSYKKQNSLMDYDDLLNNFKTLLEKNFDISETLSKQYRYIMVDEYQDTNKIQAQIVKLLAATHDNVMVVGDDSQSIYSFRGANFRNIMDFPQDFPKAKVIKLERNYRSTQPILNLTNEIINRASEKYTKKLFTEKTVGKAPVLVVAPDENYQSNFVAQKVMELSEEGVALNDIAVLFRNGYHSFDLEIELNRRGIPFVKHGGFKFIETAHVKDVLAHLRVIENPKDLVSWNRLLLLIEGIGPKACLEIINKVETIGKGVKGLFEVDGKPRYASGVKKLGSLLQALFDKNVSTPKKIEQIIDYYYPILVSKHDDYPKRAKDLEHLQAISERYRSIRNFLSDMAIEPPNESVSDVVSDGFHDETLVLSTVHSAKGLEWHSVFIIWTLDGYFPSEYSFYKDNELEEERRLMYVASTRAKENLFLVYPVNIIERSSGRILSKPSRFIDDIPENIMEKWSLSTYFESSTI